MTDKERGNLVGHYPCDSPTCDSSDGMAVYDNGDKHCFVCKFHSSGTAELEFLVKPQKHRKDMLQGDIRAIESRSLTKATCAKFGIRTAKDNGKAKLVFPYYVKGVEVAQKLRDKKKNFSLRGDTTAYTGFWGKWTCKGSGAYLVVTEGELDCASVSQINDLKWDCVSLTNGAGDAAETFKNEVEFLLGYDKIVIMFDNDETGVKASYEAAESCVPGRAHIARLSEKDANECLKKHKEEEVKSAIFNSPAYTPAGIVDADEAFEIAHASDIFEPVCFYPYPELQAATRGIFPTEIVVVLAGTGIGKSVFVREIAYHNIILGKKIGFIALEEGVGESIIFQCGLHMNERLELAGGNPAHREDVRKVKDEVFKGNAFFFNHFGSVDNEVLINKMRALRMVCGVDMIVFDHISMSVSGDSEDSNERKKIDKIMTDSRTFCQETGCAVLAVSHLKRVKGTPHEEGGKISTSQARGSGGIGHIMNTGLGLERDQQSGSKSNVTNIRILKTRKAGDTGLVDEIKYNKVTGRYKATTPTGAWEEAGLLKEKDDVDRAY